MSLPVDSPLDDSAAPEEPPSVEPDSASPVDPGPVESGSVAVSLPVSAVPGPELSADASPELSAEPPLVSVTPSVIESPLPVSSLCVVVTGVASNGVYVEEPAGGQYSAVFVFSVDGPDLSGAQIGDVVNLSGITGEYMSNTEIDITAGTYELVESGTPLDPDVVAIADLGADDTAEPWESVLIRIEGDFTVTTVAASNEFVVDDGGATARVDDFLYELPTAGDFAGFDVGAGFTAIQGPLNFFNNQFKIAGRDAADFEGYSAP